MDLQRVPGGMERGWCGAVAQGGPGGTELARAAELGLILKLWEPAGSWTLRMRQLRMQKSPQSSAGTGGRRRLTM